MSTAKIEVLVPVEEFGIAAMSSGEYEAWSATVGVELRYDYLDRPAVSLEHAYKVAESRRAAQAEWDDAESRRRIEHAAAARDLQARVNSEFMAARAAALAANLGNFFGGQVERDGIAMNEGLEAARSVWFAAPADVRDAVQSVEYEESGVINVVALGTSLPLSIISDYLHTAARRY